MAMKMMKAVSLENELDRPILCPECEGVMVYRGLGEYRCEECGGISYDNYGKVRNYLKSTEAPMWARSLTRQVFPIRLSVR